MRSLPRITGTRTSLLRLVLLLMMWQGPVPLAHSHGTPANTISVAQDLARHLEEFHCGVDLCADIHFGFHVHLIFPPQGCEILASEAGPAIGASGIDSRQWLSGDWIAWVLVPASPGNPLWLPGGTSAPMHFYDVLNTRLSLPELLGIMRC